MSSGKSSSARISKPSESASDSGQRRLVIPSDRSFMKAIIFAAECPSMQGQLNAAEQLDLS